MFTVNEHYTKKDIYNILNIPPEKQKGEWHKGYRSYDGNVFIFANIGTQGRTGHDYNNYWAEDGQTFVWEATNQSNINQPQIRKMIDPPSDQKIFLFTRSDNRDPFLFVGTIVAKEYFNTKPVKIFWRVEDNEYENAVGKESLTYEEGGVVKVYVNKFERSAAARQKCIEFHGTICKICDFDFYKTYGELGRDFIHVHHLTSLSSIKNKYKLVPENDLIPVCPNCHAMLHRKKDVLSPEELRRIIKERFFR